MPAGIYPRKPLTERFWAKVNKSGEVRVAELGPCWEWTGAIAKRGYANFNFNGTTRGAHRVSFEMRNGSIPTGKQINHLCNFRSCVNPCHLYAGTQTQNLADRERFGTIPRGLNHKNTKLSPHDVNSIYHDYRTPTQLALVYNVSKALISMIQTGKHRQEDVKRSTL